MLSVQAAMRDHHRGTFLRSSRYASSAVKLKFDEMQGRRKRGTCLDRLVISEDAVRGLFDVERSSWMCVSPHARAHITPSLTRRSHRSVYDTRDARGMGAVLTRSAKKGEALFHYAGDYYYTCGSERTPPRCAQALRSSVELALSTRPVLLYCMLSHPALGFLLCPPLSL